MDIKIIIGVYLVLILLFYFLANSLFFDFYLYKLKVIRSNNYRKWNSSANAGGSGMVRNARGIGVITLSSERCTQRAESQLEISDSTLKNKIRLVLLRDSIYFSTILTGVIIVFYKTFSGVSDKYLYFGFFQYFIGK